MMKHTRKIIFALLVASVLAMAGSAWAAPGININNGTNYSANTDVLGWPNGGSSRRVLNLSSNTTEPVGYLSSNTIVYCKVDLSSAAYYGTGLTGFAYDTPTAVSSGLASLRGFIDLSNLGVGNGFTLTLQPAAPFSWKFQDTGVPADDITTYDQNIGDSGDVLRLYSSNAAPDTIGAIIINTPLGGGTSQFTGGTYLQSGTLTLQQDSVNPLTAGPGPSYPGPTIAMGAPMDSRWATLIDNTGLTGGALEFGPYTSTAASTKIAELKIKSPRTILETGANNDTVVGRLWLTDTTSVFTVKPKTNRRIKIDSYTTDSAVLIVVKDSGQTGTLDWGTVVTDSRTSLNIEGHPVNGPLVVRASAANTAFGELVGPGKLWASERPALGAANRVYITLNAIKTEPILEIDTFSTIVAPANTPNGVDYHIQDVQGYGTLYKVPGYKAYLDKVTDAPRLDIAAGAEIIDQQNGTPRAYSGLNGTGTLTMNSIPANTTLNLIPRVPYYVNNFGNTIPANVGTLVLNADPSVGNLDSAFTQTLSGSNNTSAYTINRGILEFAKPDSIRSASNGTAAIDVAGGANAGLKLAYNAAGYNFRGPTATARAATLNLTPDATIYMTPAAINTDDSDTTTAFQSNTKPATFQAAGLTGGGSAPINIVLDTTHLPAGNNRAVKLLSSTIPNQIDTTMDPADVDITLVPANSITYTKHTAPGTADGYFYLVYSKAAGSGGGGGGGSVTYDVTIDMTTIKSADLSGGKLTVIAVSGDKASTYDLSNTKVKIVVDENDPASVTNNGNVFNITYKYPTILNGVPITVSFTDSTGAKTSFTTTAKIVNGVSVLEFPATGLPSGTYEITLSSPSGRNPFYEGKVALAYAYTAPRGLIFTMTATKTSDEKGITAYATVTSADIPQTGVRVVFTLEDGDGNAVGTTYTQTTGADGKTGTVTYPNLKNDTYTIRAAATGFNVETENVITITANANPTPDPDPTPGSGSSGSSGCDAGFGAFALLAMASGALVLRKKN